MIEKSSEEENWDIVITPQKSLFSLEIKEIWKYKDLLFLFVKRDFIKIYKQTILGPLWFFIKPLLTSLTFTLVFSRFAGISTDGIPPILFYVAGTTCWNYFSTTFKMTSTTLKDSQSLFSKVYFPRLIVPISIVFSNLLRLGMQLLLFLGFFFFYYFSTDAIQPNLYILLVPLLIIMLAGIALGMGLIITSMTIRYRDLVFLVDFGIQLAMYATPVIYPLSAVPDSFKIFAILNPLTPILETFKYGFLGQGTFEWAYLAYSFFFMIGILLVGTIIFNRAEKNFVDSI